MIQNITISLLYRQILKKLHYTISIADILLDSYTSISTPYSMPSDQLNTWITEGIMNPTHILQRLTERVNDYGGLGTKNTFK